MEEKKIKIELTEEIFKDCVGFENLYQVSNYGKIRNTKTGRLLKPYENENGYLSIVLIDENKNKKHEYMQRLVAKAFIEKENNDFNVVNHKDSNRKNNCVYNLEWVSQSENIKHGYIHGNMDNSRQAVIMANTKCYVVYDEHGKFVGAFYGLADVAEFVGYCKETVCKHKNNGKITKNGYYIFDLVENNEQD